MRRFIYHVVIRVALVLGHVQAYAAKEVKASRQTHQLPWCLFMLLVWLVFRPIFILSFIVAFKLAASLTLAQRESLR